MPHTHGLAMLVALWGCHSSCSSPPPRRNGDVKLSAKTRWRYGTPSRMKFSLTSRELYSAVGADKKLVGKLVDGFLVENELFAVGSWNYRGMI
jgi:hypothetical protein